ncbi:tripartite tricarboxylate transporter substrate binding protein [Reyranella sp. CPCC 100927]|uniref:Bug family tripartite tricarboxylate transporter substrate binding protein n=1 Tax=Reyranella sp. CPCC 100927 TaxID=2599616 RepID=UPI0011B6047A|nr:tripartite tricarboxylate transporter substrate binding protein [Reyranella sp. CPCC 100927]TWS96160.1 tripartite tricarboxylate transporter substrate binding protein [Reyranella sp. CPCC 100927]
MNISRLLPALLLGVGLASAASPTALAQEAWPTRPVRFLVPWPAGGLNDLIARAFNEKVSRSLGQSVVTDFKGGAAGRIGVTEIARAKPDGYTIGMGNLGPLTIFPSLYRQMPYSVKDDLIPITMFAASPLVLVVTGDSPIKSAHELVAAAQAKPGVLNFASVGLGSPAHLTFELLKKRTGINVVHVPYKGTNESLPAMFAGDIQTTFDTLPSLLPHINGGRLRALAVTTPQRVPQLPDVPTLKELSLADTEVASWYALIAPAGTPQPIVERLYKEYTAAAQLPEIQKLLADQGLIYLPNTMAQFQARIADETARWAQVIKDNKLEVEQ